MATPPVPAPAAAPAEAKAPAAAPVPAAKETPATPEQKPANPIESELAAQFGEEWNALPQKAKERVIASEMKGREADKRMQIAAKIQKDLELTTSQTTQLIEALKKDPWGVLKNPALGHDVRKLAEEYVWSMIEEQKMTPEQRVAKENEVKLNQLQTEKEQRDAAEKQRQLDILTAQRRGHWEKTIVEAIETAKLPNTSYVVRRFADYIKAASRSRQPADMPTIAEQIKKELVDLQGKFLLPPKFTNETEDQYEERVLNSAPSEYVKVLRKADLKRLRAKGLAPKPGPKPVGSVPAQGLKKKTMTEWLNERDQRMGRS